MRTITCDNPEIVAALRQYMTKDNNANRIGEWAIGTNIDLVEFGFSKNMLQDEKYPGHHVAVGEPCADETGARWTSKAHMDMVMRKPTIHLDDVFEKMLGIYKGFGCLVDVISYMVPLFA
ncbi:hypothetical protein CL616_00375 [archaeon]|nr:hypothetical protein [archaeon]